MFRGNYLELTRFKNSSRVFGSSRKTPSMVEVTVLLLIFCTPRITMHMCLWPVKMESIGLWAKQFGNGYLHSFDDDGDAGWLDGLSDRDGDLLRQPLLHLQASREDLHNPAEETHKSISDPPLGRTSEARSTSTARAHHAPLINTKRYT